MDVEGAPAPVDERNRFVTPARIGIGLVVLAGLVLRWFIITHSLGVLDADEATTGLVARHFLHNGEHPVFYWSSNYGGTIEAATTALAFLAFGSSVAVLKWASVVWFAVACLLAWRVGAHLIDERAGAVAALLMWVWPAPFVWWTTKSRGFYCSVLVFGLVMALCALRLTERPERRIDWLIFGLAFGLGWWDTPQIVLLGVPIGLWVLMRNWRALKSAWLAIPTWGEAWHNNHHAFPTSYRHGLKRWQIDPSAAMIRALEAVGLAWDVVRIDPERVRRKAIGEAA